MTARMFAVELLHQPAEYFRYNTICLGACVLIPDSYLFFTLQRYDKYFTYANFIYSQIKVFYFMVVFHICKRDQIKSTHAVDTLHTFPSYMTLYIHGNCYIIR